MQNQFSLRQLLTSVTLLAIAAAIVTSVAGKPGFAPPNTITSVCALGAIGVAAVGIFLLVEP